MILFEIRFVEGVKVLVRAAGVLVVRNMLFLGLKAAGFDLVFD